MKFNNRFASGYGDDSRWDETISCELADEIVRVDKANRRKRKALKQMTKAVERLEEYTEDLENENDRLKKYIKYLENENDRLNEWVVELI